MEHQIKCNVQSDDHLNFKYSMNINIEWIILSKCQIFLVIYLQIVKFSFIGQEPYLDCIKTQDL